MSDTGSQPPGYYYAEGDPPNTQRYWNGQEWVGDPQPAGSPAYADAGSAAAAGATNYSAGGIPGGRQLASAGSRIVARIIDSVLVGVIIGVLAFGSGGIDTSGDTFTISPAVYGLSLLGAVYEVVMVAIKGATLGKMAMGIGVITQDTGASPPGWGPSIMRYLISLAGVIPLIGGCISLVVFIISLVWLFSDDQRRTVADRIGSTFVVQTR